MSYITAFTQNAQLDPTNSHSSPLNSGASFVGLASSTLIGNSIQVSLRADQNSLLYIQQASAKLPGAGSSVQTDGVNLIGTGTKFTRDFRIGDQIWVGAQTVRLIDGITTDTALTVSVAFDADASGLTFEQYYWDIEDEFICYAGEKNLGYTTQAVKSDVRIIVTNTSLVNQTYLRLETILCPIASAEPRALSEIGTTKTSIYSIEDDYGFEVENTPMGEMRVVIPTRLAGSSFDGATVDPAFWTVTNTNSGSSTQASATLIMATNTTANGATLLSSVRKARYVGGSGMCFRMVMRLGDTGTANNKRRWGIGVVGNYNITITSASIVAGDVYTNNSQQFAVLNTATTTTMIANGTGNPGAGAQTYTRVSGTGPATLTGSAFAAGTTLMDGAWFQLNGTTLSVVTAKRGTETPVDSGSFNGTLGTTHALPSTVVTYEIYWTNSRVWFVIEDRILHTFVGNTTAWTGTMNQYIVADNVNSGGSTTLVNMYVRVASIRRLGPLTSQPISKYQSGTTAGVVCKYSAGNLHGVTINTVTNNGAVVTLLDGISSGGGNTIWSGTFQANTSFNFDFKGLPFYNGLTLIIATQNANVVVIYE
jgi:hypothetical protein